MENIDNYDMFKSLEEFIDNMQRGGEIEFFYKNQKYSITRPQGKICFIKIGDEFSEKFFDNIDSFLEYKIDETKIKDIATVIEPYFRCF